MILLFFFSMGNSKRITSIFLYIKNLIFYWCFRRHFYSKTNNKKAYKRKYTTTFFVSIVAMEPAQHPQATLKIVFCTEKNQGHEFVPLDPMGQYWKCFYLSITCFKLNYFKLFKSKLNKFKNKLKTGKNMI